MPQNLATAVFSEPQSLWKTRLVNNAVFVRVVYTKWIDLDLEGTNVTRNLRMYCLDTPGEPESSDAGTFHCLYD